MAGTVGSPHPQPRPALLVAPGESLRLSVHLQSRDARSLRVPEGHQVGPWRASEQGWAPKGPGRFTHKVPTQSSSQDAAGVANIQGAKEATASAPL